MKKISLLKAVGLMVFTFAAVSQGKAETPSNTQTSSQTEQSEEEILIEDEEISED